MNAEHFTSVNTDQAVHDDGGRPDLSNANVREDVALAGRCGLVHLPSGRTCLLPLRHQGPCDFHGPGEATEVASAGN